MPRRHGCRQSCAKEPDPGLPNNTKIKAVMAGIKILKIGVCSVQNWMKSFIMAHPHVGQFVVFLL